VLRATIWTARSAVFQAAFDTLKACEEISPACEQSEPRQVPVLLKAAPRQGARDWDSLPVMDFIESTVLNLDRFAAKRGRDINQMSRSNLISSAI